MAATVTSGGRWPDGSRCERGHALIWSGEDDPADTLLPRLIAAGADKSRVHFISGTRTNGELLPFDPSTDMVQLAEKATHIGNVRLIVVDPVVYAVTGDSHNNTDVRRALAAAGRPRIEHWAALVGISHFSKPAGPGPSVSGRWFYRLLRGGTSGSRSCQGEERGRTGPSHSGPWQVEHRPDNGGSSTPSARWRRCPASTRHASSGVLPLKAQRANCSPTGRRDRGRKRTGHRRQVLAGVARGRNSGAGEEHRGRSQKRRAGLANGPASIRRTRPEQTQKVRKVGTTGACPACPKTPACPTCPTF